MSSRFSESVVLTFLVSEDFNSLKINEDLNILLLICVIAINIYHNN